MARSTVLMLVMAISLLTLTGAGCSAPYVNIPPQAGDVAAHNPNMDTVRTVQIKALRAVIDDRDLSGPLLIELPEGTDSLTYAAVADGVGDEAVTPMDEDVEPAMTLTVEAVRVRAWEGGVDVLVPVGGVLQRTTVYLDYAPFSEWRVLRVYNWTGRVEVDS